VMRNILAAVVLALAALVAVGEAGARDARRLIARPTYEGKLIMEVEEACPPEARSIRQPRLHVVWRLKTAKKTYELNLRGGALTRLAEALDGRDVIVTGPLQGDTITVRRLESKPIELVGTLRKVEKKDLPVTWKLKTADGEFDLVLVKPLAAQAEELAGKRVSVKGQLTIDGLAASSIEEALIIERSKGPAFGK